MPALKVLFNAVPSTSNGQISGGPPAGKVWVASAIYVANTGGASVSVTLIHRISATDYRLLSSAEIPAGRTVALGPIVIEEGQSIWASASAANTVHISAYGFEDDV